MEKTSLVIVLLVCVLAAADSLADDSNKIVDSGGTGSAGTKVNVQGPDSGSTEAPATDGGTTDDACQNLSDDDENKERLCGGFDKDRLNGGPEAATTTEPTTVTTENATTPTVETTSSDAGPPAECVSIPCDFEQGHMCAYDGLGHGGDSEDVYDWDYRQGRFKNYVTGIRKAGEGEGYAAVYLKNGGKSGYLSSMLGAPTQSPMTISFLGYEATTFQQVKACCVAESGAEDCPWSSDELATKGDMQWLNKTVTCQPGTKKVEFHCLNNGKLQGACGVDNIKLVDAEGNDLCPVQSKARRFVNFLRRLRNLRRQV